QVPVHDSLAVGLVQSVRDLDPVAQRLLERRRALDQSLRQRLPFQILHDQVLDAVLVADVVERADVRVRELRDRLRFPLEPLARLGRGGEVLRQDLDRDGSFQTSIPRLVDLPHAPRADRGNQFIGAETRAACERHWISRNQMSASARSSTKKMVRSSREIPILANEGLLWKATSRSGTLLPVTESSSRSLPRTGSPHRM